MQIENSEVLFEKPLHEEVSCPWYTEDYFGHNHPCTECENNEILQQDMDSDANWLVESGVVGVRNQQEETEAKEAWVEAMNIVIKERKEEVLL